MRAEFENLEKGLKKINIKKVPDTFLSIINKKYDEVTISRYLAYLLNPINSNIKVIENLLDISTINEDETDFCKLLNDEDTVFETIEVEEPISSRSRIDIMIRFSTFMIVIENKINSMENNVQSVKYEEDLDGNIKPIKYICIKPKYNSTIMENKKFAHITYDQIIEILKTISKYDLEEPENYYYIEDFIKHVEGYLMKESQLEITEDVEFYMENKEIIDMMISNYRNQCNLVTDMLEEIVKNKFGDEFEVFNKPKWGFLQIWKRDWINEGHNGIHYEILWNANKIIGDNIKMTFAIHNEAKTNKTFPEINHHVVKVENYKLDDSNTIIESLTKIADEMYKIAEENNAYIDNIVANHID